MAKRRMFSTTITSSSQFLMMPQSSQNLYFHLGMNADDDGFVEHFTIMRMTESKPDDLAVLQERHFVKIFDTKVLIITDWKENNYIRSDRYNPSKYLQIYKDEVKLLSKESQNPGIPSANHLVGVGKGRVGKGREEKNKKITVSSSDDPDFFLLNKKQERTNDCSHLLKFWNDLSLKEKGVNPEIDYSVSKKKLNERLKKYSVNQIENLMSFYLNSKKSKENGVNLNTALSTHTVNLWLEQEAFNIRDDKTVIYD